MLMENNYVMGAGISLKTLLKRLNGHIPNELTDQDEDPGTRNLYPDDEDGIVRDVEEGDLVDEDEPEEDDTYDEDH